MGRRKARNDGWSNRAIRRRKRARAMGPAQGASCGKIRYTTQAAAEAAAELKADTEGPERRYPSELRTYYHHRCRGWHLSSQPKRSS